MHDIFGLIYDGEKDEAIRRLASIENTTGAAALRNAANAASAANSVE